MRASSRKRRMEAKPGPGYEGRVEIGVKNVDDPYEPGRSMRAQFNVRHDALENEYARKRISLTAYMAGRVYQGTWDDNREAAEFCMERISRIFSANDIPIILGIDKAKRVNELRSQAKILLGPDRERLVNKILSDNKGIEEVALENGYSGTKQRYYVGETFRQSLEILGDAWFCS